MSKRSDGGFVYFEQSGSNVANDYYLREIGEKDKYEKDRYCCNYSYKGAMLRFMVLMNVMAWISRLVQFEEAEEIRGEGAAASFFDISFDTNYRANIVAIFVGHVLFFIALGIGWLYVSKYIKKYKILKSDISEFPEMVIVGGGSIIQLFLIDMAGGIFNHLTEPSYASTPESLWPFCTFAVAMILVFKAHDSATDDTENKDLDHSEESDSSEANDYSIREIGSSIANDYYLREIGSSIANEYYLREIGEKDK